jgi:hypothetical protein
MESVNEDEADDHKILFFYYRGYGFDRESQKIAQTIDGEFNI